MSIVLALGVMALALFLFARSFTGRPLPPPSTASTATPAPESPDVPPPASEEVVPDAAPAPLESVAALRARCVAEARSGAALAGDPGSACQQFARASRAELPAARTPPALPEPASDARSSPPSRLSRSADALEYVPIAVRQCRERGYGTIPYRECRAQEWKRLRHHCLEYTRRIDFAHPSERQHIRALARSYCREADRYQVVD